MREAGLAFRRKCFTEESLPKNLYRKIFTEGALHLGSFTEEPKLKNPKIRINLFLWRFSTGEDVAFETFKVYKKGKCTNKNDDLLLDAKKELDQQSRTQIESQRAGGESSLSGIWTFSENSLEGF